jgi:hypothetical protein
MGHRPLLRRGRRPLVGKGTASPGSGVVYIETITDIDIIKIEPEYFREKKVWFVRESKNLYI